MSDLDFERKHAEDLQRLRGLRLLDDDFMNKVFEDKACAEFLHQRRRDALSDSGGQSSLFQRRYGRPANKSQVEISEIFRGK